MSIHPTAYQALMPFGKYKGMSLGYIAENHRGYLEWMAGTEGMPLYIRESAARILMGEAIDLKRFTAPAPNPALDNKVRMWVVNEKTIGCKFPKDDELRERFKAAIDGRKWNPDEFRWEFAPAWLPKAVELFGGPKNILADDGVKQLYREEITRRRDLDEIRKKQDSDIHIPGMLLEPYPYQKVALEFIERAGGRAIVADQMGLGKTITAIAYAMYKNVRMLTVCPKSVVEQWRREIKKFTGIDACVWTTKGPVGKLKSQFHIINYEIVARHVDALRKIDFDLLTCDEATYLKNYKSIRTKTIFGSWKERKQYPGLKTKYLLPLTGTPVLNRPIEAFTLLSNVAKDRFNNPMHFIRRYGTGRNGDSQNLKELHERTKDIVIRRLKKDVASELGEKQRFDLVVELTDAEKQKYQKLLLSVMKKWGKVGRPSAADMPLIRNELFELKFPRLIEFVDEMTDSGRPVLVFTIQVEHATRIAKHYGTNARLIHGGITGKKRAQAIDDVRAGKAQVMVMTLGAGSMGIDGLQEVIDAGVFVDQWFVPSIHEQAEDRLHRKGQKGQVQWWYMMCEDTYDEIAKDILWEKLKDIEMTVDGKEADMRRQKNIFKDIVKRLRKQFKDVDIGDIDAADVDEAA